MRPDMVKVIFDRGGRSKSKSLKTSRRLTQSEAIEAEDFDDEDNDAGHSVQRRGWRDYSWPRTNPRRKRLPARIGSEAHRVRCIEEIGSAHVQR